MRRFLEVLAVAIVLVFVATIGFAFAADAPSCPSGSAHISTVEEDLSKLRLEAGWETTAWDRYTKAQAELSASLYFAFPGIFVAPEIMQRTLENVTEVIAVHTDGKPNVLLVWFDKNQCFLSMGALPRKEWTRMVNKIEREGA